jgi:hypothetical protein
MKHPNGSILSYCRIPPWSPTQVFEILHLYLSKISRANSLRAQPQSIQQCKDRAKYRWNQSCTYPGSRNRRAMCAQCACNVLATPFACQGECEAPLGNTTIQHPFAACLPAPQLFILLPASGQHLVHMRPHGARRCRPSSAAPFLLGHTAILCCALCGTPNQPRADGGD